MKAGKLYEQISELKLALDEAQEREKSLQRLLDNHRFLQCKEDNHARIANPLSLHSSEVRELRAKYAGEKSQLALLKLKKKLDQQKLKRFEALAPVPEGQTRKPMRKLQKFISLLDSKIANTEKRLAKSSAALLRAKKTVISAKEDHTGQSNLESIREALENEDAIAHQQLNNEHLMKVVQSMFLEQSDSETLLMDAFSLLHKLFMDLNCMGKADKISGHYQVRCI